MRRRVVWLERQLRERRAAREEVERFRSSFERLRALYRGHPLPPEHPGGDFAGMSEMIEQRREARAKARAKGRTREGGSS
jgi:hypothetical protein